MENTEQKNFMITSKSNLYYDNNYFDIKEEEQIIDDKYSSISSSISSDEDNFNFYNVNKQNVINYMTPIKVNNALYYNQRPNRLIFNQTDNNAEISDIFSLRNTEGGKKVMVSELDIELSDSNSKKNINSFTEYKSENNNFNKVANSKKSNNQILIKMRQIDFKKQFEQNLNKFLKINKEKELLNNKNDNNNIINSKLIRKNSNNDNNIKFCLTHSNNKISNISKIKNNNNNIINNIHNKSKKFSNYSFLNNKLSKKNTINNNNNFHKKINTLIKLNISKKLKERKLISNINKKSFVGLKKSDIKSKIFLLQRKKINNNFNITNKLLKKKELKEYNEYLILNRNNRLNVSEQKRNKVKTKYNSIIKKNNSKIIIQNFNCIDYNNININITDSNLIKSTKLSKRRNTSKTNIIDNENLNTYNNTNNNIHHKIFMKKEKKEKKDQKKILCNNNYLKNKKFFKINTDFNNSNYFTEHKKLIKDNNSNNISDKFMRKNNEKKLTFIENNLNVKNQIINKYFNTINYSNNNSINNNEKKQQSTNNNRIIKIRKQKTFKIRENNNINKKLNLNNFK
jgi:hypothetical protein